MANKDSTASTVQPGEIDPATGKKKRKSFTRTVPPLAIVATVVDSDGNSIPDAELKILTVSKDVTAAFKVHKSNPGSVIDVIETKKADEKAAA